jgi:hypothetical protein
MRPYLSRASVLAWFLALAAACILAACGGGQAPILGTGSGVSLPPAVSATVPVAQNPPVTGVAINTRITATFNKAMNPGTLSTSTFTLACPGGSAVTGSVSYDASGQVATFVPSANLPVSTLCVATLTTGAQDTGGIPLQAAFVWSFTTSSAPDTTAPTVTSVNPAQDAVAASNTAVTASFSEDIAPSTISASSFTLKTTVGDTPVVGTVAYSAEARTATFTPTSPSPLPTNTSFTATVSTTVTDLAGNALATNKVWTFSTSVAPDTTAPTVSTVVPAQSAVAANNTLVTATFSEDIAPSTISASSFTLKTTVGDSPITGTVAYSVGARTATFTPTSPSPLPANTSFTATVSTAITDLAGNAMVANKVWTFTTAALADTTPPTVVLVNPIDTGMAVCINKTVSATFSEAMDPLTLTTATVKLAPSSSLNATVAAVVSYDTINKIASIDPSANLAPSTSYTATVLGGVSGAKDLAANAMVADKVWQFTTGTSECQLPVPLGSSSNFAILASAAITNIPTSIITGDVGLTPDTGAGITGFSSPGSCPEIVGRLYAVNASGPACALIDAALLSNAKTDALAAFTNANNAVRGTPTPISTNLAGLTLYPGLYASGTTIDLSAGGSLTLDAQGDANAVFVIRSATAITTLSTSQVVLSGGAKASNVFWTAGSAITLGANSIMKGTLVAGTAITLQTGANLEGRALNQGAAAAAISCDSCTITVPTP